MDNNKSGIEVVGGHASQIRVSDTDPKVLIKGTRQSELDFYESVFNPKSEGQLDQNVLQRFKSFMPEYFGKEEGEDSPTVKISNLMYGKDQARVNIADLKLGTSTITANCRSEPEKMEKRIAKDNLTTSPTLGFKFTGFSLQDH